MAKEVKHGEIYWMNWNAARSSEQSGIRPALIIQNDIGNKFSPTTIVASCSTAIAKAYPFLVSVTARESGLPKDCTVNLSSIVTVAVARLGDKCGSLSRSKMAEIDAAIKHSLALEDSVTRP